jgi:hypothetical protein
VKLRRTALLCLVFAGLAQLASGCCHRPYLLRPWCRGGCWPHCYQPAGAAPMGGPDCSACFSAPAGPGPVFTGSPQPLPGPSIQTIPMGTPMPTGGVPKTGN